MNLRLSYCIIISLILVVGLIGNLFIWQNAILGFAFGSAYLIFFSFIFGFLLFDNKPAIFQFLYGLLFLISGVSFLGAIIYYFYQLNDFAVSILIIFIPFVLLPLLGKENMLGNKKEFTPLQVNPHLLRSTLLVTAFVFLTILNFRFLSDIGTTLAVRSPWKIIPFEFFITYFLASLVLLIFILKSQKESLNLIFISVHTFLTVSLVLFVYKIGYGFDPFIHQATEKIISLEGQIIPKPFYYLGQYSLVVFLSKIWHLPIEWVDKILLPALISLFLPATLFFTFRTLSRYEGKSQLTPSLPSLLVLALPFCSFIVTVPQGLANFYLLIIIFLGLMVLMGGIPLFCLYFLGFTAFLIHPLAGLPGFVFIFLLTLFVFFKKQDGIFEFIRQIVFIGSFVLSAVALPLVFIAASLLFKNQTPILSLEIIEKSNNLWTALNWPLPALINHFRPLYDLVYTYGTNITFILLILAFVGFFLSRKKLPAILVYIFTFFALIINFIIIKLFVAFPFLIKYEQNVFPQRILEISFYFLIPLFLFALYKFFEKLNSASQSIKIFFILLFALALTFSLYLSYPRDDGEDYHIDRGYSVSDSDIKAVHAIADNAGRENYIVLANQSVSAAAVREFGFAKYFGPHFYYPIPTGDPLYQYYLKMVYEEPSRATIGEAADLTGVHLVYFVLNQYWTDADEIIEKTKVTTNDWQEIDNGKILIFKYQL